MFGTLFKRGKRDSALRRVRWRLESCVETVLDLNSRLGEGKIRPDIIEHFRKLQKSFILLEDDMVDEREVSRIEEATNQLFEEIGKLYDRQTMKSLYDVPKH